MKINLELVSYFLAAKNVQSIHHVCHAFHHMFTTKTPRPAPRFPQNPLQKRLSTTTKKTAQKTLNLIHNSDAMNWSLFSATVPRCEPPDARIAVN
jgi:hypothetical protein